MSDIFGFTDTWNAVGTTFAAIKCNVTNTASATGSSLIDMQIASASVFRVDKNGDVIITGALSLDDTTGDHQYLFGVSELVADRTVTLPLLAGNDTFVFEAHAATLTNKTIALGSNTVTGTKAQFDTAVTDGNIAYDTGAHHDGFSDFVANEHIDHTAVTLAAGTGLDGGGDISANRTFDIDSTVVTLTGTQVLSSKTLTLPQINDTSSDHQYVFAVSELVADRTVTLPLLTGNDTFIFAAFAATFTNKTISLSSNTVTGTKAEFDTALSDGSHAYDGGAHHDGFSDFVANEHVDHSSVTLTAGTGLDGGGDLTTNRTFDIDSTVATLTGTQTLTNKTLVAAPAASTVGVDIVMNATPGAPFQIHTSAAAEVFEITSDGHINIGGNAPISTHQISVDETTGNVTINFEAQAGNVNMNLDSGGANSDSVLNFRDDSTAVYQFFYDGSNGTMRFTNVANGDVLTFNDSPYECVINQGGDDLNFRVEASGSNDALRVNGANGDVAIGTAVDPTGTSGKVLSFGDNVGDPTMGTNVAGIYAKDVAGTVEMFVIDEADNASQISPHDPDTGEWIFYSENNRTGKRIRVDMERFFRDQFPQYMVEDVPARKNK